MKAPDATTRARVEAAFNQLPLYFIENQGQLDERVAYYIQAGDKTLYFTPEGVTFALTAPLTKFDSPLPDLGEGPGVRASQRWVVKLDFVGANPDVRPIGEEKTDAIVSYFKGSPDQWHTGIPTYARILYQDLWPGIDLVFYGTVNQLKYEFIVHPGADPGQIRLAYRGAEIALNAAGQLEVTTPVGGFTEEVPLAYQEIDGRRVEVAVSYDMESPMHYPPISNLHSPFSFQIGSYDPTHPLVIDPVVLIYCGYIGSGGDYGFGIAVDGAGAAYVVGTTYSSEAEGFPVVVGPDLTFNGGYNDAFVAKVKADGTGLSYCGYIGGSYSDWGNGIAVDGAGAAYVVGETHSSEAEGFPVVVGPDPTFNGGYYDAFVAKVKADGTGLSYCGYIGGSYWDFGYGIAVDGAGAAYVVGWTESSEAEGFPVVVGPDLTFNGGYNDAFVARVKADGTGLSYCGYIGGSYYDFGNGIAVDGAGAAYVVGDTDSSEAEGFPVVVGPDLTFNGGYDAFVARVKADGTDLDYCGYIGGSGGDYGFGIAVDGAGAAYVVGTTYSSEAEGFPVVVGPDLTFNGGYDAFVARVKADGTDLDYCGYIGGSYYDLGYGIAVDGAGAAYVVGWTESSEAEGFPVVVGPDLTFNGGDMDAFVARVKADGTDLDYCGYIGGSGGERGNGIAVDGDGAAYVVGETSSSEAEGFPVVVGPDTTHNGSGYDAFVAKVSVTYYISGRVSDAGGRPVSDVTVSAGATYSATTGADGTYTITDLEADTYTLTPAKSGYVFSPPMRTVSVPPSVTGQNFAMLPPPVSTALTPGTGTSLTYTDTQGLPTTLDFPAEAVTQTTTIVLTPTLAQGGAGFAFTGHAFDLAAFQGGSPQPGFTFGAPVTVTIHYSDDDVRVVTDESQLVLQWWTGSEWRDAVETCEPASSYSRDIANNVLSLPICHLSRFGLFGPTHQTYLPLILRNR